MQFCELGIPQADAGCPHSIKLVWPAKGGFSSLRGLRQAKTSSVLASLGHLPQRGRFWTLALRIQIAFYSTDVNRIASRSPERTAPAFPFGEGVARRRRMRYPARRRMQKIFVS